MRVSNDIIDHEYERTPEHLDGEYLETLRARSDDLADKVLRIVQDWSARSEVSEPDTLQLIQLFLRSAETHPEYEYVKQSVAEMARVPDFVDWKQIERGQNLFVEYLLANGTILFYLSLIGGYSSKRINKVLTSTGYLSGNPENVLKRLRETQRMVVDVMKQDALVPGNIGWKSVTRVRFLHAKIRQRILRIADPDRYSAVEDGIPINQEDLAFTLCGFSYLALYGMQKVFKINFSEAQLDDYCALWRLIGVYMGIETPLNPCESYSKAKIHSESFLSHLVQFVDPSSTILSRASLLSNQIKGNIEYRPLKSSIAYAVTILGENWEKLILCADKDPQFNLVGFERWFYFTHIQFAVYKVRVQLQLNSCLNILLSKIWTEEVYMRWKRRVIMTLADKMSKKKLVGNKFDQATISKEKILAQNEPCEFHDVNSLFDKELFVKEQICSASLVEMIAVAFTFSGTYISLLMYALLLGVISHFVLHTFNEFKIITMKE